MFFVAGRGINYRSRCPGICGGFKGWGKPRRLHGFNGWPLVLPQIAPCRRARLGVEVNHNGSAFPLVLRLRQGERRA